MDEIKIQRINELARKSKTPSGLTEQEKAEQKILRQEYITSYKRNLVSHRESIYIVDENGNKHKVEKKK